VHRHPLSSLKGPPPSSRAAVIVERHLCSCLQMPPWVSVIATWGLSIDVLFTGTRETRSCVCPPSSFLIACRTPYVLITDVDVLFMRRVSVLDLMFERPCTTASMVCDVTGNVEYVAKNSMQSYRYMLESVNEDWAREQSGWINGSAYTLGLEIPDPREVGNEGAP
jgi:hypothetical protein